MALKDVRVDLPKDEPQQTLDLVDEIIEEHIALGAASPLTGKFDIPLLTTTNNNAKTFRKSAKTNEEGSQSAYNQCAVACGLGAGQNKQTAGSMYVSTLAIRDTLMNANRVIPEKTSELGFEVVVTSKGGQRYVRIDIPKTPEGLLKLAGLIIAENTLLTAASPLVGEIDMAAYAALVAAAQTLLDTSVTMREQKESLNNQAIILIGYGAGQNSLTPNTLYWFITGIRDRLLKVFLGTEEKMSVWGFKVVISSHLPGRKKAKPVPPVK